MDSDRDIDFTVQALRYALGGTARDVSMAVGALALARLTSARRRARMREKFPPEHARRRESEPINHLRCCQSLSRGRPDFAAPGGCYNLRLQLTRCSACRMGREKEHPIERQQLG